MLKRPDLVFDVKACAIAFVTAVSFCY